MLEAFRLNKKELKRHECSISTKDSKTFPPKPESEASCWKKFCHLWHRSILISEYNPRALFYYRSTTEIYRIRKKHVERCSKLIHPFSPFRMWYEVFMTFVLFYALIAIPLNISFDVYFWHVETKDVVERGFDYKPHGIRFSNMLCRLIFLLDIYMNFRTGYIIVKQRKVIMNQRLIIKNYVFSFYFITDLLSLPPEPFFAKSHNAQRIVNCLGFFKVFRIPTFLCYLEKSLWILHLKSKSISILKHIAMHGLLLHWLACALYFIPQIRYFNDGQFSTKSWTVKKDVTDKDLSTRYVTSLYRVVGAVFSIDFDPVTIESLIEKVAGILSYIFGKVYMAYVTIWLLNEFLADNTLRVRYDELISQLQAYMTYKRLPLKMQTRVLQHYEYKYNQKYYRQRTVYHTLSDKLKTEISLNVCRKFVENVTILKHLPQHSIEQLVTCLQSEIFLPNDIIIKAGLPGDSMYFLASGTVAVWTPSGKEVCHLQDGAYFGEISLIFKGKRRSASVVALEICEVYRLEKKAFKNCFRGNAEAVQIIEEMALQRMETTQIFEDVHTKTFMEITK